MSFAKAMAAAVVSGSFANVALAADELAPQWDINAICATASAQPSADCLRVENQNRTSVLNRWSTYAAGDKRACEPGSKSYERLLSCLDDRAMKAMENPASPSDGSAAPNP